MGQTNVYDRRYALQGRLGNLVAEILGDKYMPLKIDYRLIEEGRGGNPSSVVSVQRAILYCANEQQSNLCVIDDVSGVGALDALFGAIQDQLVEYPSLAQIEFVGFEATGRFDTAKKAAGTDAAAATAIIVKNGANALFRFIGTSTSTAHSSILALVEAVEYFVNAERAALLVRKWIANAQTRGRTDLVGRYTNLLSELVRIAGDYSDAFKQGD